MTLDTYDRVDLTGPWAGFGFQARHMFTPEGRTLHPEDMKYWSLTCNIAHEWALMMAEEREARSNGAANTAKKKCRPNLITHERSKNVIYLRDVLRRRREMRLSVVDGAGSADRSTVVRRTRGPRAPRRG
ncbi:DUF3653 domain-containing protein [Xanthomonas axonopodis pv. fascicularis]|uniref:DUF3653 domain-containing protein n=1 Tax=Xanthomonas axonopodis TaxID=53413 RepID=UPI003530DC12